MPRRHHGSVAASASSGRPVRTADVVRLGRAHGLDAVGVASAEPFAGTRAVLEERRAAGLHGSMQFTYRNPARSTDPSRTLPGARALVVGARGYRDPEAAPARDGPVGRVARYMWADHYGALDTGLNVVAEHLVAAGWRAIVISDENNLVDRAAAHRAGLGWFGRNSNLLLPGVGSWFVLGSVITDAALEPTGAVVADGCGSCNRCTPACPTGAIVAPGVIDARRCLAWVVQAPGPIPSDLRVSMGDRIYGCDDCQDVCPPNRVELRRRGDTSPAEARSDRAWVDLLDLLAASDATLLERHGRWYIAGRDPRWLRRNALVALGNTADPADERVLAVLVAHLDHPDPILRAHAVWALRRLDRDDLAVVRVDDCDPDVRAEVAGSPPPRRRPAAVDVLPVLITDRGAPTP